MAMTLRFPPELDAALQRVADANHTSKHSVVLLAVEEFVINQTKTNKVMASVERTLSRDAELLARLEDS